MPELDYETACAHPIGFCMDSLGLEDIYDWQCRVLADMVQPGAVALRAANGSGKTQRIAAPFALWHATAFPRSTVVVTAGVWRQVKDQFFASVQRWSNRFIGWKINEADIVSPDHSRIIGFATDDPGKFEGWHGTPKEPLLMIVDEAKSVKDTIFEAIDRCQPQRLLLMSSPGGMEGEFYRAFTSRAAFYRRHVVKADECPHISREWIENQIAKWGIDHPLIRSMIFAEFSDSDASYIVRLSVLDNCLQNPPVRLKDVRKRAFCDFAAGGDENVLAVADGNLVSMICWRDADTMRTMGRFIAEFTKAGLSAGDIYGDEGGLGKVICDALRDGGWAINRVNNGGTPNEDSYADRGSEIWCEGARAIEKCEYILPDDAELRGQLTSRKHVYNSRGKLKAEPKPDMKKRGLPSPDRADAVLGVMVCGRHVASKSLVGDVLGRGPQSGWLDWMDQQRTEDNPSYLPGCDTGG